MKTESVLECTAVADQDASGFERRVEPLMRVHGHGVCGRDAREVRGSVAQTGGKTAVSAVHVKPQAAAARNFRELAQGVHRSR